MKNPKKKSETKLSKARLKSLLEGREEISPTEMGDLSVDDLHSLSVSSFCGEAACYLLAWRKRSEQIEKNAAEVRKIAAEAADQKAVRAETLRDLKSQWEKLVKQGTEQRIAFHEILSPMEIGICKSLPSRVEWETVAATGRDLGQTMQLIDEATAKRGRK